MSTCQKCQHKWSWQEVMKKAFTLKMKMTCPHCSHHQYMSAKARKRSINFSMVLQLIWLLPLFLGAPSYFTIGSACIAIIISLALTPSMLELSNEEEPLW